MKKILNGPTVWRAKCPVCDCEFEYDVSETIKVYDKTTLDVFRIISVSYTHLTLPTTPYV